MLDYVLNLNLYGHFNDHENLHYSDEWVIHMSSKKYKESE